MNSSLSRKWHSGFYFTKNNVGENQTNIPNFKTVNDLLKNLENEKRLHNTSLFFFVDILTGRCVEEVVGIVLETIKCIFFFHFPFPERPMKENILSGV